MLNVIDDTLRAACFLCRRSIRSGPATHDGRRITQWDLMVCNACYDGNRDGLAPEKFPKLLAYLAAKKIDIKLNEKGWVERP